MANKHVNAIVIGAGAGGGVGHLWSAPRQSAGGRDGGPVEGRAYGPELSW